MNVPKIPTYREIETKLSELEAEHQILGERYRRLKKQLNDKHNPDDGDNFLLNYAKNWR